VGSIASPARLLRSGGERKRHKRDKRRVLDAVLVVAATATPLLGGFACCLSARSSGLPGSSSSSRALPHRRALMLALLTAFVVACLLFLSKPCARDMRLFLASLFQQLALSLLGFLAGLRLLGGVAAAPETMPLMPSFKRKRAAAMVENVEEVPAAAGEPSVLDLPELAIDCILERLPPAELRNMAAVCRSMRERCRSDHLWERHMSEKWGRVLGRAARDEWRAHLASASESSAAGSVSGGGGKRRRWLAALSCVCPVVSWMRPRADSGKSSGPMLDDSIMSWYLSMESGKFWFPAQVYNREVSSHVLSVTSSFFIAKRAN
jgi:hypothetical protein